MYDYFQQIKEINSIYKPNTATFLMLLFDKHKYWASDPDRFYSLTNRRFTGHFYLSRPTIEKEICMKRAAQKTAEQELEADGIITITPVPGKAAWYKINQQALIEKIEDYYCYEDSGIEDNFDYPFDESEDYEEWVGPEDCKETAELMKKQGGNYVEKQESPPHENDGVAPENSAPNNNRLINLKNKNKVSKATYCFEATEAVDQDLDCNKNTQDSCIKENSCSNAPPRPAHSGNGFEDAIRIIEKYNSAMQVDFSIGQKELNNVADRLEDLKSIEKLLTPRILEKVWSQYSDEYIKKKIPNKRISAFIKTKLLDKLLQHKSKILAEINTETDLKLDHIFKKYEVKISDIAKALGYSFNYGSLEPLDGSVSFTPKEHRELRLDLYHKHIKPLLPKEELHDMMILEV